MTDHAREAAEKCYYELYHGDERFNELVPKFETFDASPVPEWVNAAMVLNEPSDNETIVPGVPGRLALDQDASVLWENRSGTLQNKHD